MKKSFLTILVFAAALIVFSAENSRAEFRLSARPFEGGFDLNFGNLPAGGQPVSRELSLSVNSTIGKQYQVIQTLLDPLTNGQGRSLPQEALVVTGLRGSNLSGTLLPQDEFIVSSSRTILYTSSPQGTADTFRLIFSLKGQLAGGSYRGRIAFTLEPINASVNPSTVILNIFAEVSESSKIDITGSRGGNLISLKAQSETPFTDRLSFNIPTAFPGQFRIFQALTAPLENNEGQPLPQEAIKFSLEQVKKGSGPVTATPLSERQETVYTSASNGDAENFLLKFNLAAPEAFKSGIYRGQVRFLTDAFSGGPTMLKTFNLEAEIPRVMELTVSPESGGVLYFRVAPGNRGAVTSEITVEIKNNTGKQYQITQKLTSELVSKEGRSIPEQYFTLRTDALQVKGQLRFPQPAAIKNGDMTVFVSDKQGDPDKFQVIYELKAGPEINAGDYSTGIIYSISEI